MLKVIILSASKYSLLTISVIEELRKNNISPNAVIVQEIFNLTRFFNEFRRNPSALIKKIIRKLIFRRFTTRDKLSLAKLFKQKNYQCKSLDDVQMKYGVTSITCNDFHEKKIINYIKSINCDLIIFTGGGIIKGKLLKLPRLGILNCHMGILPKYRGMNCHTWAIINNDFHNIGLTTHFMDDGIDTGNILKTKVINLDKIDNYDDIEDTLEYFMPEMTIDTVMEIANRKYTELSQNHEDGQQYYFIKDKKIIKEAKRKFVKFKKMSIN